jgi:hypothetical protein
MRLKSQTYAQNQTDTHIPSTGNMSFPIPRFAQLGAYRVEVLCVGDSPHQIAHPANHALRRARGAAVPQASSPTSICRPAV